MARQKREDTIIASFEVDKFLCEYDGHCWTVNSDDNAKQFYYSTLESMCISLLHKISSAKIKDSMKNILDAIREAKQDIEEAVKYIDIKPIEDDDEETEN